ncbi:serine protease inhibitor 42Dd-like [Eupeodes corollae]|uniref:serine protease inhibitor 42Dd-like n=1 Tax=Eupeodes corollae TaxID=290404 RepID=UPI002490D343|nr:serine protease inhibitor 42Dd-like [Eupeodes corollae]XP_055916260.1 serine protease inhibitor 42Dd-like [Eupeodes corollae]XP_055916261.1 serine protease inhibitor 42Dd-like [Eupeodes corollae]XP_055916262.1 serine protease inhibitor 42Dd-like [Eupeodes corollae]
MTTTTTPASNKGLFAADLFHQICKNKSSQNLIISPISVQTALAITYIGAKGETATELQSGLRLLVSDVEQVGRHFANILLRNNGEAKLSIANRIFTNDQYKIVPFFKEIATKYFDSDAEQLDFSQSSKAINIINKWVEEKTNKKITNVVQDGSVDCDTKAIIVNAIYFKGKWKTPFSKDMTRKSNFWVSKTESVQVDTIYGSEHFKYGEFPELNATAVEMPYKDSDISMILILPKERDGLADLESKLSSVVINEMSAKMCVKSLDLYMPKFKIEFTTRLTDTLKALGIRSLFENANLPEMFVSGPPVKVSDVHHKAFIEVNEAGSEAAAATIVKISPMSLDFNKKKFNADHPFVFAITSPEIVYFVGHLAKF